MGRSTKKSKRRQKQRLRKRRAERHQSRATSVRDSEAADGVLDGSTAQVSSSAETSALALSDLDEDSAAETEELDTGAPDAVAVELDTVEAVTPEPLTPRPLTPQPATPRPVAPQPDAPEPSTADSVAPHSPPAEPLTVIEASTLMRAAVDDDNASHDSSAGSVSAPAELAVPVPRLIPTREELEQAGRAIRQGARAQRERAAAWIRARSDSARAAIEANEKVRAVRRRYVRAAARARRGLRRLQVAAILSTLLLVSFGIAALTFLSAREIQASRLQSRYLSQFAQALTYEVVDGPSKLIRFPSWGPYDSRHGYTQIPRFVDSLSKRGFTVTRQAQLSEPHAALIDYGVSPIYSEKSQAGLRLFDRHRDPIYVNRYPEIVYRDFESIPPLVRDTLLFIEDRQLLDPSKPFHNPAIDWGRFAKALGDVAISRVKSDHDVHGGSTLAVQTEKFRHSREGITWSGKDKLLQMFTASLRAYRGGEATLEARQDVLLSYLNSVPLGAVGGYGEVNGLADGLWAYYGTDFSEFNDLLSREIAPAGTPELDEQARAYRKVLSLFLAHRRPTDYLSGDPKRLRRQVSKYLPFLASEGIIPERLYHAARHVSAPFLRQLPRSTHQGTYRQRKAENAIRVHLLSLLGMDRLYDLDRLDLDVETTLDFKLQAAVNEFFGKLQVKEEVKKMGLVPDVLGSGADLSKIIYSFTLYERAGGANLLRVQTDSFNKPFNLNEGAKLDLGSTAKLRTLVTYLEVVEELYMRYSIAPDETLRTVLAEQPDPLTRWAVEWFLGRKEHSLMDMLQDGMERRYSASPGERFFTAGGLHTFHNFNRTDNGSRPTVAESLRRSINLPFIRLMRDIVFYFSRHVTGSTARTLDGMKDEARREYLEKFADREGTVFLLRFYQKYKGKPADKILEILLDGVTRSPTRYGAVFCVMYPDATFDQFTRFMRTYFNEEEISDDKLQRNFESLHGKEFSLQDKGYIARTHPLELWIAGFLSRNADADFQAAVEASRSERQEVYKWLFSSKRKRAQNTRIQIILEEEAFHEIHRRWRNVGYPLDSLVPSYATSLGASADRPEALAELVGILLNDGLRVPDIRLKRLEFAADTPFHTVLERVLPEPRRALSPEVARVARAALLNVVQEGTARRLRSGFKVGERELPLGGKTGTGDHRYHVYGAGGRLKAVRVVNRTATFVFFIGDRFFGTITALVPGSEAADYSFTSALPVQLLKLLEPSLSPLLSSDPPADLFAAAPATAPT